MKEKISITAISSLSPLGETTHEIWNAYLNNDHYFSLMKENGHKVWVAPLSKSAKLNVETLRKSDQKYKKLDDSVLFAILASRKAIEQAGWQNTSNFGINMGSSRGATKLFEEYHQEFLNTGIASTLSSPTTTLGNISSWVSHDLGAIGPEISHSITCSTGLHSLLNGVAWLNSGMVNKFLIGASEAPLTNFTIAQMKALKIYAKAEARKEITGKELDKEFPCQALYLEKEANSMILGEAATVACLEPGKVSNALAVIEGVGYATEILKHNTSISTNAECFQKSMKMAMGPLALTDIDAVVMHAPGTVKGDLSEYNAIKTVFGGSMPLLTTNKWKLGHTFATSGLLNLELAILMLRHDTFIPSPFFKNRVRKGKLKRVLINAVGFGGNAVSILLSKNE
ncbi:beta-ketoacyl synthase N-terminal-like domain-containing protein [Maribacter sp. LLG6340-A2]|uniref:beta-ketoacyl synthase N-terminal-like domain-containing protein n=1 Tax=Maribacter sp. LLG6340-A2 TaxID=3160834 RepID=UPI003869C4CD